MKKKNRFSSAILGPLPLAITHLRRGDQKNSILMIEFFLRLLRFRLIQFLILLVYPTAVILFYSFEFAVFRALLSPYEYINMKSDITRDIIIAATIFVPVSTFVFLVDTFAKRRENLFLTYTISLPGFLFGFLNGFATTYKYLELVSTYCAADSPCPKIPIHDGAISLYFAITTLTTVGFGDYIPANNDCRACAALEALSGYLILAIMIACIIDTLSQRKKKTDDWS